jgi:hypothetical protein
MSVNTTANLLMVSPLVKSAEFYQQLLRGVRSYEDLGNRILGRIKAAHAFRQLESVRESALLLSNLPLKQYQKIGQYYLAWCERKNGDTVTGMLESLTETAPAKYRAYAMHVLATIAARKQDTATEFYWLTESLKVYPSLESFRGIAILKAREGFHASALKSLEDIIPLIKHAEPLPYYDFLNSYAVELGKASRISEARNVINHVTSSPLACAYPEWQETAKEVKEPSRASISVPQIEPEPVEVEVKETSHAGAEAKPIKPGRVVAFPELKEAPEPKRPDPLNPQELEGMTLADKREFLLAAIRTQLLSESEYDKLIYSLGLMNSGPASDVIDLEDKALLDDIIEVWCNMIEPDQFAAVMSALRDCKDDQRRESIMDDMISFAYQRTPSSRESESEWRRKVERRLPNK